MEDFSFPYWPEELVPKLLSFLPNNDRLNSSLVCKQWLHLLNYDGLLKDICVRIPISHLWEPLPLTRKFTKFYFKNVEINEMHVKFLKDYGENIKSLTFERCCMNVQFQAEYYKLRTVFKNLTVLRFYYTYLHIFSELPQLKEFTIKYACSDLSDYELFQLDKTMPSLEKFEFDHNLVSYDRVIRRFYPGNKKWHERPSPMILSLPAISDFIQNRAKSLVSLGLGAQHLKDSSFNLLEIENLKLKKLTIFGDCEEFWTPRITDLHKTLTEIHLIKLKLDDKSIRFICDSLPLLEKATFRETLLNHSIKDIFALKNLHSLDIGHSCNLKNDSVQNAIETFQLDHLRCLDLNSTNLADNTLRSLLGLLLNLHVLNLSCCEMISNETVQFISENLYFLRRLSLSGCLHITDEGIWNEKNPKKCISNLNCLEELSLNRCFNITADVLEIAVKFVGLRIFHYHDFPLKLIRALKSQNPSLKSTYSDFMGLLRDEL